MDLVAGDTVNAVRDTIVAIKESNLYSGTYGVITKYIKDISVAIASVVGAYVGVRGLLTWWDQIRGEAEFKLARRMLKKVYEIRKAVRTARSPFGSGSIDDIDRTRHEILQEQFSSRWEDVNNKLSEIETYKLEAKVLWSEEVLQPFDRLDSEVFGVYQTIDRFLRSIKPGTRQHFTEEEQREIQERVWLIHEEEDEIEREINEVISEIEKKLEPHIQRPSYSFWSFTGG